jgi:8-oxo-dGDP phosphatase
MSQPPIKPAERLRHVRDASEAQTHNPWQTLAVRPVYANPWIRVSEYDVLRPNGTPGIYGVVHMQNRAALAMPVDSDGYTVLVGQWRYTLGRLCWELPAGGAPVGSSLHEAALRELTEETGLVAGQSTLLNRTTLSNSSTDGAGEAWLCWELSAGTAELDETEDFSLWRLPVWQAVELALDGTITDTLSQMALLTFAARHARGALPQAVLGAVPAQERVVE